MRRIFNLFRRLKEKMEISNLYHLILETKVLKGCQSARTAHSLFQFKGWMTTMRLTRTKNYDNNVRKNHDAVAVWYRTKSPSFQLRMEFRI
jgi:hypothetical protein